MRCEARAYSEKIGVKDIIHSRYDGKFLYIWKEKRAVPAARTAKAS